MMLKVSYLGLTEYQSIWERMKDFTASRAPHTEDELWLLEHYPVFTQGQAGKPEHIHNTQNIPLVLSDRGGQVTYHGPGQLVAYTLMDIERRRLGVRNLVCLLEQILIKVLAQFQIPAETRCKAPGVYVGEKKIASIGLRVKNGCTYHGIALNVAMDLQPFSQINPCGFAALQMTQINEFHPGVGVAEVATLFTHFFLEQFEGL